MAMLQVTVLRAFQKNLKPGTFPLLCDSYEKV